MLWEAEKEERKYGAESAPTHATLLSRSVSWAILSSMPLVAYELLS